MDELEIKQALNTLADWRARSDLLESDKRALIESVKVSDDVQNILRSGMQKMGEVEKNIQPKR